MDDFAWNWIVRRCSNVTMVDPNICMTMRDKIKDLERLSTLLSGTSPVAQLVKDLPAVQETPVQFLGQEDLLEKG